VSAGISPSFMRFFCFILRFWNQIFTCVSFRAKACAISILLALVRYLLKWNSFSSSVSCFVVKLVLPVLFAPAILLLLLLFSPPFGSPGPYSVFTPIPGPIPLRPGLLPELELPLNPNCSCGGLLAVHGKKSRREQTKGSFIS